MKIIKAAPDIIFQAYKSLLALEPKRSSSRRVQQRQLNLLLIEASKDHKQLKARAEAILSFLNVTKKFPSILLHVHTNALKSLTMLPFPISATVQTLYAKPDYLVFFLELKPGRPPSLELRIEGSSRERIETLYLAAVSPFRKTQKSPPKVWYSEVDCIVEGLIFNASALEEAIQNTLTAQAFLL